MVLKQCFEIEFVSNKDYAKHFLTHTKLSSDKPVEIGLRLNGAVTQFSGSHFKVRENAHS